MSTTPSHGPTVFDLPLGQRTPTTVTYLGLEYPGEVVLSASWQPALERLRQLTASLTPCTRPPNQLALGRTPRCNRCGIVLGQRPPSQDIATVVQEVQGGLKEQTLRLSTLVVHRVLRGPMDRHMARFIRMVEASNVSGLVQVLDDQIVAFVREVLQGP